MGFDLNRHWQEPSPWAHPTLYATKNLLMEMDRNEVSRIRSKQTLHFSGPMNNDLPMYCELGVLLMGIFHKP